MILQIDDTAPIKTCKTTSSFNLQISLCFSIALNSRLYSFLVFILLGYGSSVRQIMLNLHDLEMITSQYAYFTFEITPESCKGNDGRDEAACEAFEGIMDISNYIPSTPEYKAFEGKVRQKMPQFAGLGYHMQPDDEVRWYQHFLAKTISNLFVVAIHSCFERLSTLSITWVTFFLSQKYPLSN